MAKSSSLFNFGRNLRESVHAAIMEQERLSKSEKDIQIKYNELLGE